jgi:hypothetical protein
VPVAPGAWRLGRLANREVPNNTTEIPTLYTVRLIWNHGAGWRWGACGARDVCEASPL